LVLSIVEKLQVGVDRPSLLSQFHHGAIEAAVQAGEANRTALKQRVHLLRFAYPRAGDAAVASRDQPLIIKLKVHPQDPLYREKLKEREHKLGRGASDHPDRITPLHQKVDTGDHRLNPLPLGV